MTQISQTSTSEIYEMRVICGYFLQTNPSKARSIRMVDAAAGNVNESNARLTDASGEPPVSHAARVG